MSKEITFQWACRESDSRDSYYDISAILVAKCFRKHFDPSRVTLVKCDSFHKDGRQYRQFQLEQDQPHASNSRSALMLVLADDSLALQAMTYTLANERDSIVESQLEYVGHEGVPALIL